MKIIKFDVGDILEMKKEHPCGSVLFSVARTGSVVRIVCCGCGRDVSVPRDKLERSIRKVLPGTSAVNENNETVNN